MLYTWAPPGTNCFSINIRIWHSACSRLIGEEQSRISILTSPEKHWLPRKPETQSTWREIPPFWKQTLSSYCFFLARELVQGLSHLRFNIHRLYCIFIQPLCINFHIKMADVTHYGIILHLLKVPAKKKVISNINEQKSFSSAPEDALVHSSAQGKMKSAWLTDCIWLKMCGSGNLPGTWSLLEKTLKLLGKRASQGYKRLSERKYFPSIESKTILFNWSKLKYPQLLFPTQKK